MVLKSLFAGQIIKSFLSLEWVERVRDGIEVCIYFYDSRRLNFKYRRKTCENRANIRRNWLSKPGRWWTRSNISPLFTPDNHRVTISMITATGREFKNSETTHSLRPQGTLLPVWCNQDTQSSITNMFSTRSRVRKFDKALYLKLQIFTYSGTEKETPWHHDQAYYPVDGFRMVAKITLFNMKITCSWQTGQHLDACWPSQPRVQCQVRPRISQVGKMVPPQEICQWNKLSGGVRTVWGKDLSWCSC